MRIWESASLGGGARVSAVLLSENVAPDLDDEIQPLAQELRLRSAQTDSAKILGQVFVSEIISYPELVAREKANLQKGMNFGIRKAHSIILMSVRRGAPYHDRLDLDRNLLIYEGHDVHRSGRSRPEEARPANDHASRRTRGERQVLPSREDAAAGRRSPERVKVYEKIHRGVWSDKGFFHLVG